MSQGSGFYIVDNSKVKGRSKEPDRVIFNLEVDNIEDAVKKLDQQSVKKVQDTYHVEGYGLIATFEDLDGNYFQFVQVREN
jgi:predicted enzyme related to lactoylglutathione lyase